MAKKRVKRHSVGGEIRDALRSFAGFLRKRTGEVRQEIGIMKKKSAKKKGAEPQKYPRRIRGFLLPLISASFGILCIFLVIVILNAVNANVDNLFIKTLTELLSANLYLLFGLALFFGYADYLKSNFKRVYWIIEPIANSMAIIGIIAIIVMALNLFTPYSENNFFKVFANILYPNLEGIFAFFLAFGYVTLILRIIFKGAYKIGNEEIV
jgi:hypothetical protein